MSSARKRLDNVHGLASDQSLFTVAPGGIILFRALLFLAAHFVAKRPPNFQSRSPAKRRGWSATTRGTRAQRGYGWAWEKLRARILKAEPLCRACRKEGRATVATTVDHITPKHKGGTDDEENLQSLCDPCHKAKTAAEGQASRQ
ncbi:HNH endonuclease signature motif containing protein [Tsuneonella suprasediminis]|uniref:HNH endonuclease n=1 Tax=Tsuneonella suprasediminis TaxID=2306996 RepID=UPI002F938CBF